MEGGGDSSQTMLIIREVLERRNKQTKKYTKIRL